MSIGATAVNGHSPSVKLMFPIQPEHEPEFEAEQVIEADPLPPTETSRYGPLPLLPSREEVTDQVMAIVRERCLADTGEPDFWLHKNARYQYQPAVKGVNTAYKVSRTLYRVFNHTICTPPKDVAGVTFDDDGLVFRGPQIFVEASEEYVQRMHSATDGPEPEPEPVPEPEVAAQEPAAKVYAINESEAAIIRDILETYALSLSLMGLDGDKSEQIREIVRTFS